MTAFLKDSRLAAGLIAAISALLLGGALAMQYLAGLAPCSLCLLQRYPHIAVIVFGVIAFSRNVADGPRQRLLWLMALCLFGTAGIGLWHAGIEYGLYTGPSACTGTVSGDSVEALKQQLMTAQMVRCDEIPWSLFGISLAGYNAILSIAAAIFAIHSARAPETEEA